MKDNMIYNSEHSFYYLYFYFIWSIFYIDIFGLEIFIATLSTLIIT